MVEAPKAVLLKALVCTLERQTLKASVELRQHQKDGVRGQVIVPELALQLPHWCQSQAKRKAAGDTLQVRRGSHQPSCLFQVAWGSVTSDRQPSSQQLQAPPQEWGAKKLGWLGPCEQQNPGKTLGPSCAAQWVQLPSGPVTPSVSGPHRRSRTRQCCRPRSST